MSDRIVVRVATSNTRGFLLNLLEYDFENLYFEYDREKVYEISNNVRNFLASTIKLPVFDFLGIFQVIDAKGYDCNYYFSYNRFLNSDREYIILLENPSALVNYCWERPKHLIAKRRLRKLFLDPNLKGIVCMSQACYSHIKDLYIIPERVNIYQIYPFIVDDFAYSKNEIMHKTQKATIKCLFISSDFNLKGGCDLIEVAKNLERNDAPVHITCITKKESIKEKQISDIDNLRNIDIVEFNLSKEKLNEYYKETSIFLNPTRLDSFSLVTLEALKYGCALLATDVYAIKEMIREGKNGYLTQPMYKVWDQNGTLNKYIRTHKKTTVYSGTIDSNLVEWMTEKIVGLVNDRNLLERMCEESLKMARDDMFSERSIANKWKILFTESQGGGN